MPPAACPGQYLPGECLLDAVKAALRVIFPHIGQVEVKVVDFTEGIIFGNFDKLKGGKERNTSVLMKFYLAGCPSEASISIAFKLPNSSSNPTDTPVTHHDLASFLPLHVGRNITPVHIRALPNSF